MRPIIRFLLFSIILPLTVSTLLAASILTPDGTPITTYPGSIEGLPEAYASRVILITTPDATVSIYLLTGGEQSFIARDVTDCQDTCRIPLTISEPLDLAVEEADGMSAWRIIPDTHPPELADFMIDRDQLTLRVKDDHKPLNVSVNVKGGEVDETLTAPVDEEGRATLIIPPLEDGVSVTFTIILQDAAGNTRTIRRELIADTHPPRISLPEGEGPYKQGGVRFTVQDDKPFPGERIKAWINDAETHPHCTPLPDADGYACMIPSSYIPEGSFTLRVQARDAYGNTVEEEAVLTSVHDTTPPIPLGMESTTTFTGKDALGSMLHVAFDEAYGIIPSSVRVTLTPEEGPSRTLTATACDHAEGGIICTLPIPSSFHTHARGMVTATLISAEDTAGNPMPDTLSQDFIIPLPLTLIDVSLSTASGVSQSLLTSVRRIPLPREPFTLVFTLPSLSVPPSVNLSLTSSGHVQEVAYTPEEVREMCITTPDGTTCALGSLQALPGVLRVNITGPDRTWERRVQIIPQAVREDDETIRFTPTRITPEGYLPGVPSTISVSLSSSLTGGKLIGMENLECEEENDYARIQAGFQAGDEPLLILHLTPDEGMHDLTITCTGRPLVSIGSRIREYPPVTIQLTIPPVSLDNLPSPEKRAEEATTNNLLFNPAFNTFMDVSKTLITACDIKHALSAVSAMLDTIDTGLRAFTGGTINIKFASDSIDRLDRLTRTGVLGQACKVLTCQADFQKQLAETFTPAKLLSTLREDTSMQLARLLGHPNEDLSMAWNDFVNQLSRETGRESIRILGSLDDTTTTKPEDYLITSILTACPKGIILNVDRLRQTECKYAYCLRQAAEGTIPTPAVCERVHAYEQCSYWGRELEAFLPEGLPGILNKLADLISHPVQTGLKVFLGESLYEMLNADDATIRFLAKGFEVAYHWDEYQVLIQMSMDLFSFKFNDVWQQIVQNEFGQDYCQLIGQSNGGGRS